MQPITPITLVQTPARTTTPWPAPAWRACELCDHGTSVAGERLCTFTELGAGPAPRSLDIARAPGGVCGPEANHLTFPGLHNPPAPAWRRSS